ncbi:MAG: hypothetical protein WCH34_12210 [Bacteroidota bacterium]
MILQTKAMLKIGKANNVFSLTTLLILFSILVVLRFIYPPTNVLSWDVFGYYLYLPSKFIYHDLGLSDQTWLNKLIAQYNSTATLYQAYVGPIGKWVMKYSMGMAILYMPFFFLSHALAPILGYPADGFSLPYQYGIAIGALIYTFVGLVFFRKILLHYFSDKTATLIMILTILGTNYLNQASVGNLLSHNFLFSFVAALVWFTIKWHEKQRLLYMLFIGMLSGIITLVRPNEGVCIIIPFLWGVFNKETLVEKLKLIWKNKLQVSVAILAFVLVLLPQFYYWNKYTGSYIFYSYPNPGEGLDLLSPHISNFLFSFRKGWFVYTPMVIFSLVGLVNLYRKRREIFSPILIYSLVSFYLISSWTCWWYAGGCYSQRAIISLFVVLAIPLGFFIERLIEMKCYLKYGIYILMVFIVGLNCFQFWQFQKDILKHDGMTEKYYLAIFGKTKAPTNASEMLLVDRLVTGIEHMTNPEKYYKKILGVYDFSKKTPETNEHYTKDPSDSNSYCLAMDSSLCYSPGPSIKYKNITGEYYAWIRAKVEYKYSKNYDDENALLVITFDHKGGSYKYFAGELNCTDSLRTSWTSKTFDYQTPEVRDINDELKVYVWHRGKKGVYIKGISVDVYEPIISN